MDHIEPFVRRLCAEGDLSVLTKKLIRKQYQSHFKKDVLSPEEKEKIHQVLEVVLEELAEGQQVSVQGTECVQNTVSVSPEQGKENLGTNHFISSPSLRCRSAALKQKVQKLHRSELESSSGQPHPKRLRLSLSRNADRQSVTLQKPSHYDTSPGQSNVPLETEEHSSLILVAKRKAENLFERMNWTGNSADKDSGENLDKSEKYNAIREGSSSPHVSNKFLSDVSDIQHINDSSSDEVCVIPCDDEIKSKDSLLDKKNMSCLLSIKKKDTQAQAENSIINTFVVNKCLDTKERKCRMSVSPRKMSKRSLCLEQVVAAVLDSTSGLLSPLSDGSSQDIHHSKVGVSCEKQKDWGNDDFVNRDHSLVTDTSKTNGLAAHTQHINSDSAVSSSDDNDRLISPAKSFDSPPSLIKTKGSKPSISSKRHHMRKRGALRKLVHTQNLVHDSDSDDLALSILKSQQHSRMEGKKCQLPQRKRHRIKSSSESETEPVESEYVLTPRKVRISPLKIIKQRKGHRLENEICNGNSDKRFKNSEVNRRQCMLSESSDSDEMPLTYFKSRAKAEKQNLCTHQNLPLMKDCVVALIDICKSNFSKATLGQVYLGNFLTKMKTQKNCVRETKLGSLVTTLQTSIHQTTVQNSQTTSSSLLSSSLPSSTESDISDGEENVVSEWMVSSSSPADSLKGGTRIILRKTPVKRKRNVPKEKPLNLSSGVSLMCSDFSLDDLPLVASCREKALTSRQNNSTKKKSNKILQAAESSDEELANSSLGKKKRCLTKKLSRRPAQIESSASEEELPEDTGQKSTDPMEENGMYSDLDTSSLSSITDLDQHLKCNSSKEIISLKDRSTIKRALKSETCAIKKKRSKLSSKSFSGERREKEFGAKRQEEEDDEREEPYLKRLRLICRKVGIFVRNDIHFVGCHSDKDKIQRLKEALKKAGMKGQPSLNKVDSVNLLREAAALDPSNIIETTGRPRREIKGLFVRGKTPPKKRTPVKQQFSRIQDLIADSDTD